MRFQGTLTPAYGRDYKSRKEVIAAFDADNDFQVQSMLNGGNYTNKEDLLVGGYTSVNIRFKKLANVICVKFGRDKVTK